MRKPFYFLLILMVGLLGCSKSNHTSTRDPFRASIPAPAPPDWIQKISSQPDWWSNTVANYHNESAFSNKWTQLTNMEANITASVREGISPIQERRELIKFLSLWRESPGLKGNDHQFLSIKIAEVYEKLGLYKRSTKEYAEVVKEYPSDLLLYSLAIQYERVGEKNAAMQIYHYMANAFPSNSIGFEIAMRGTACLNPATNIYALKKPDWWNEYQSPPNLWTNESVTFPKISCFDDGYDFFMHNIWRKDNPSKHIEALAQLSKFSPITFNEEIRLLLSICHAYSDLGDHHRAIEYAWKIPDQYPNIKDSKIALKFIASEFEKLGETNQAQKIQKLLQ